MKRSSLIWTLVVGGILVGLFVISLVAIMAVVSDGDDFRLGGGEQIAVIPVEGVIGDEMAKTVNRQLKQYGDDSRIKAILLRIDSPGGGVSASQEIYREVKRVREEKKKKVVASMATVAASGGYYIACPADRILANPGTITGSIGVIAEWLNYKELVEWAKLKPVTFKSGEMKDTGSPTREMTEADKKFFQGMIDELYLQFVTAVNEGRQGKGEPGAELTFERVKVLADGRVYTGEAALKNGLIDELGNYQDAIRATAKLAGIKGEPRIVTPPKPREGYTILDLLFGETKLKSLSPAELPNQFLNIDTSVKFKYQLK